MLFKKFLPQRNYQHGQAKSQAKERDAVCAVSHDKGMEEAAAIHACFDPTHKDHKDSVIKSLGVQSRGNGIRLRA